MWLFVVFACTPPPDDTSESRPERPVETGDSSVTAVHTGATGDTASPVVVPMIGEALAARCSELRYTRYPLAGDDLHRVTLGGTTARCNDGTPAIMWVRAATDPAHAADWIVHLDGGNLCRDHESCAVRWCGEEFHDASKMSSLESPEAVRAAGLLSQNAANPFGGWNVAQVHYCSSDLWVGAGADRVLDGDPPYRLHFEGANIVAEAIRVLDVGATSDDGVQALAGLSQADTLLFTGSSAGGYGVVSQLDAVADMLPGVQVLGVDDSILTPLDAAFDDPSVRDAHAAEATAFWTEMGGVYDAQLDASCVADLGSATADCGSVSEVVLGHVSTPLLLHYDLSDVNGTSEFMRALDLEVFVPTMEATLRALGDAGVSVHGTNCGVHQSLLNDFHFAGMTTIDAEAGGPPMSVSQAMVALLGGQWVEVVDDVPGTGSVCN